MAKKKKESLSRTLAEVSKGVTKTVANDKSVSAKVRKQAKSDYRKASRISNSSASKNYISNSRLRRTGSSGSTSASSASMANRMRGESASQRNAGGNTIREIARSNTPKKNSVSRTYSELQNKTKDMNLTDTAVGRGMARAGLTAKGTAKEVYGGVKTTFSAIRDPNEERNIKADRLREQRGEQTKGNKYEGAYDKLRNAQRDNREQRAKDLKSASKMLESASADKEKAKKGLGKAGKFALDVESALLGMAGDAAVGAVTGTGQVGALTSMAVRSFGGGYDKAKREGASDSQAALYAAVTGGKEVLTEKMFNVGKAFSGVFGKGLGDDVINRAAEKGAEKLAKKFGSEGAKNVILHGSNYLASALTEGLEEVASTASDPFVANAIYARAVGNPHSFDAGDTFYDFLVGAALGGLGGGIAEASNYSQGGQVKNVLGKDGLKEVADRVAYADEDSGISDSAKAISQMILNGENVANAQALKLYKAAEAQEQKNFTQYRDAIKGATSIIERDNLISPSGLTVDESGQVIPSIGDNTNIKFQEARTEARTEAEKLQLKDDVAASIGDTIASIKTGIGVVDDIETIVRYPEAKAVYESVTGETLPSGRKALREYLYRKNAENRVQSAREETEFWKDQAVGLLSQTETEEFGGNGQAVFTKATENLDVNELGNSALTKVRTTINDYYNSAKLGIPFSTLNEIAKPEYDAVSEDIKREAYNAGILDSNDIYKYLDGVAVNKDESIKSSANKENRNANPGKLYVEADNAARKYFTNSQQKLWKILAEEFGVGIHIMDAESFANALKSKGQNEVADSESLPNGFYDNGEIYLNVETPDRATRYVFMHEFTHFLEQTAPKEYSELRKRMIDALIEDGSLERRLSRKRMQYGEGISQDDLIDEILADSTYEFLNDKDFANGIAKESESLAQAIINAIRNLIRKIRNVLARDEYTPSQNANMYAQLGILKDMETLWLDAVNAARENAGVAETADSARFSLTDNNGNALSEGQQEYFKNSKVRDENGNLKVVYHGTNKAGFTVFNRTNNFYTDSKDVAGTYTNKDGVYEGYLNITKPLEIDVYGERWSRIDVEGIPYEVRDLFNEYGISTFEEDGAERTSTSDIVSAVEDGIDEGVLDYDGIIFKNIYDEGMFGNAEPGTYKSEVYVTFNSNQFKNIDNFNPTEDPDIRFSMKEPVEETKELLAIHNLSVDKLRKSLELGGLPMPSIAITKARQGHTKFGEVSLVFGKDTIDPEGSSANTVYSGDAYTPTFPSIDYELNEKKAEALYARANKVGAVPMFNPVILSPPNIEDELKKWGGEAGLLERFKNDYGIKNFYLAETSTPVSVVKSEKVIELDADEAKRFDSILKLMPDEIGQLGNMTGREWNKLYGERFKDAQKEAYRELNQSYTDEALSSLVDNVPAFRQIQIAQKIKRYAENGAREVERFDDYEATNAKIDKRLDESKYNEWLKELFKGIVKSKGIRNNKDTFTPNGNRRNFGILHYEYNLENIVKAMKEEESQGKNTFGGGNIRGAAAEKLGSVDEIKQKSSVLQNMTEEEYNASKREFDERFHALTYSLAKEPTGSTDAAALLVEAIVKNKTKSGIASYIKREGKGWTNYSDYIVNELLDLVNEIRSMPREYFEAKPRRVVDFNEIYTAVIPNNTPDDIRNKLNEYGINSLEYESGNNIDRIEKLNSIEGVRFSKKEPVAEAVSKYPDDPKMENWHQETTEDGTIIERLNNANIKYSMPSMNILVACEESQAVVKELRKLGHNAYSCDIQDQSGGHPEWHVMGDVSPMLNGNCEFTTNDGQKHKQDGKWDMIIAFPPCTHLALSGARWFEQKRADGRQREAIEFFASFFDADCDKLVVENPSNIIGGDYIKEHFPDLYEKYEGARTKPTQRIQPWMFGDNAQKTTCLWLKGVPELSPMVTERPDDIEFVEYTRSNGKKVRLPKWYSNASGDRSKVRSKTFKGVAENMALQFAGDARDVRLSKKENVESVPTDEEVYEYMASHPEIYKEMWSFDEADKNYIKHKQNTYAELETKVEQLKQNQKKTHGKVLDEKSVRPAMNELVKSILQASEQGRGVKKTDNKMVNDCVANAKKIFTAYKNSDTELMITTSLNAAESMVESLKFIDDSAYVYYKDLRDYLRNTPIRVSDTIKGDIADYSAWRKSKFGKIRISDVGIPVDDVYTELCEKFPEMFDRELSNPTDQLLRMGEAIEEIQPYVVYLSSEEYDNLIRQTAGDLIDIAVKGRAYKSMADRYEERISAVKQRAEEAKRDAQKKKKEAVSKEREKASERLAEEKDKRKQAVSKEREKADARVAEEKEKRKKADNRRKEAYKRRKSMKTLVDDYKWLSDRILKPTDDKHVPDRMVQPLAELLQYIDLETEYSKKFEEKTGQPTGVAVNLRNLKSALEDVSKSSEANWILEDEDLPQMIEELQKRIESAAIYELDNSELDAVQALLHAIRADVSNANKAFVASRSIDDTAKAVIWDANEYAANSKKRRSGGIVNQLLNESMVKPMEFFEHLGPTMKSVYMGLRRGMDVQSNRMKETRAFFAEVFEGYGKKGKPGSEVQKWRNEKTLQEFELESGEKISLNTAQIMSLHCLSKRKQAMGHIRGQGICASEIRDFGIVRSTIGEKEVHKRSTTMVTRTDIINITSVLTDEQVEMANKLQNFMNTVVAEWGNETSLLMYDRKKFTEENYFPIETQDVYLDANFEKRQRNIESIKNFGFTKGTVVNANNPIVIDDIFAVVAKHVNQMILYNAYAPAISDFTRVYNYREVEGNQVESVQAILADTYGGKIIDQYISKFMSDLQSNTQTRRGGYERVANILLANYKKAAIGASPRVALQQPTAMVRALAEIDAKYFVKMEHSPQLLQMAMKKDNALKEMLEHCPIAYWKSMGFNQVDMARDIEDIMMNMEWSRLDVLTMSIYGALDTYTWSKIWKAIKAEQKDLHPEVEYESDEFWELCNERAIEVFDKTQVVDSVFHRSDVMRSDNLMIKSITSFMSEPTTTFNMLRANLMRANDLRVQGKGKEAFKLTGRTIGVYVANAFACAMAAAIADAILKKQAGDDDDEENKSFIEFWLANTIVNFKNNVSPLNLMPITRDFSSFADGWGTKNMFEEGIALVIEDAVAIKNKATDPASTKKTWEELITELAKDSSYLTGIPVKNFMRYGAGILDFLGINAFAAEKDSEGGQSKSLFGEILEMAGFSNGDDSANSQSQSLEAQYEESWLTKKLHEAGITEGTRLDNVLNFFGLNKSIEEQKEEHYQDMLSAAKAAGNGYVGVERDEKIYSKATDGYTKLAETGEFEELARIRRVLVELDVDTTNFDERVESHIKTGIKKQIGEKGDSKLRNRLLNQLKEVYGYTDEQISTDVLAKTDTATAFQKALCEDNYDEAVKQLRYLRQAGLTYDAFIDLYEKRWKVIDAKTTGTFNWPAHGRISSGFGQRWGTLHAGIDIAMPTGTEVVASDGGEVVYTGYNSAMGNYVDIKHSNGYVTRYQHLSSYGVLKGEKVKKGQYIASSGNTGNSTGPHLHFAVYRSTSHSGCSHSTAVDPSIFLKSS